MPTVAISTAWVLWRRHRWAAVVLLLYGAVLTFYAQASLPGPPSTRLSVFLSSIPLMFGLLYVMAAFAYPDADIMSPHSGFPRHMLVLPARTRELVFWPMLLGATTIALGWIGLSSLILIPAGASVSPAWPAALLATLLASLQALSWSALGVPYLRLILALLLFPILIAFGIVGSLNGLSAQALTTAYLCLLAPVYFAAVSGLAHARCGDNPEWKWLTRRSPAAAAPSSAYFTPFASPMRAQLWFEWRRHGIVLPLLVGGVCTLLTIPLVWMHDLAPLGAGGLFPAPRLQDLEVNIWVKLQQGCLFWPVILAAIAGSGLRKSEGRRKDLTLPPFLATRPLCSRELVLAKLQAAALSTLAAWAIMLFFLFSWLLTPARDSGRPGTLGHILLRHVTPETGFLLLTGLLILILWTWKNQVQGLCVDLTGRRWIVYGVPATLYGLGLAGFVLLAQWSGGHHEMDPHYHAVAWYLPWLVGLAVTLKALGATMALRELLRRRLVTARVITCLLAIWLLLTLGLFGWLSAVTRAGLFATLPLPSGLLAPGYLAAVAVLFLPLTRLALAPLALEWNRHG